MGRCHNGYVKAFITLTTTHFLTLIQFSTILFFNMSTKYRDNNVHLLKAPQREHRENNCPCCISPSTLSSQPVSLSFLHFTSMTIRLPERA